MIKLEVILAILPIIALFAGLVRYLISEIAKRKDKRVNQLLEIRNQIQNDIGIANVMFLCETNTLTNEFFRSINAQELSNVYKDIVKTLGLFDSMCYSFLSNNLGKAVFVYFIGEMKEVILNKTIREYLDFSLERNVKLIINDKIDENNLFDSVYPYGFFQVSMRLNALDISSLPAYKLKSKIQQQKRLVNIEIYNQFFIKK
jgi:hypothetical protein